MPGDVAAYVQAARRGAARGWRLPTPAETMREACPFCGANVGEPCRSTGSWRITVAFHAKRMKLATYRPERNT